MPVTCNGSAQDIFQPSPQSPADEYERSLASKEGRSRSSAVFFEAQRYHTTLAIII